MNDVLAILGGIYVTGAILMFAVLWLSDGIKDDSHSDEGYQLDAMHHNPQYKPLLVTWMALLWPLSVGLADWSGTWRSLELHLGFHIGHFHVVLINKKATNR